MKLYFMRHGMAGDPAAWEGADEDRPLTSKGRKRLADSAKMMKKMGLEFDWILTSPLKRAYQTAKIVAGELDLGNILREEPRLGPGFDTDKLLAILQEYPGVQSLLLVGHEPGFSATTGHLIGGGRLVCKKGSLVRIDLEEPLTLQGELVWLIPPAVLAD